MNDPKVMFLDEPTSGLDPIAAREVHTLIGGLRERGVTVFLTTHRLDEAEKLCDRVAILNTTLKTIGRPAELRNQLFHNTLIVKTITPLSDPGLVFGGVESVDNWRVVEPGNYELSVSNPQSAAPEVTRRLVANGADVLFLGESRHSLEDVYLAMIDEDVEVKSE